MYSVDQTREWKEPLPLKAQRADSQDFLNLRRSLRSRARPSSAASAAWADVSRAEWRSRAAWPGDLCHANWLKRKLVHTASVLSYPGPCAVKKRQSQAWRRHLEIANLYILWGPGAMHVKSKVKQTFRK